MPCNHKPSRSVCNGIRDESFSCNCKYSYLHGYNVYYIRMFTSKTQVIKQNKHTCMTGFFFLMLIEGKYFVHWIPFLTKIHCFDQNILCYDRIFMPSLIYYSSIKNMHCFRSASWDVTQTISLSEISENDLLIKYWKILGWKRVNQVNLTKFPLACGYVC